MIILIGIIWTIIIVTSITYMVLNGKIEMLNNAILDIPKQAFDLFLTISINLLFWSGILEIAKKGGFLTFITNIIKRIIKPLFKGASNEALEYISGNISANILGLGSAATPFGLKAMEELQKQNNTDKASKNMITLLILNTAGVTLIPTSILSIRRMYGSNVGTKIIPYVIVLSISTMVIALIIDRIFRRLSSCT